LTTFTRAGLIIGGVSSIAVFLLPETLASRILWLKAAKLNKMNNCQRFVGPADAHRGSVLRFMVSDPGKTGPVYVRADWE
jgi:hypothetical protein